MRLVCPQCQNAIELDDSASAEKVLCPSCGSSVHLEAGSTGAGTAQAGTQSLGRIEMLESVGSEALGTAYLDRDSALDRALGQVKRLWWWSRRNPVIAGLSAAAIIALFLVVPIALSMVYRVGHLKAARAQAESELQRYLAAEQAEAARQAQAQETAGRLQAEEREQKTRADLRLALLHQADALLQSSVAGRRGLALEALKKAAAIRPGADLRDVYLRCLDLPDQHTPSRIVALATAAGRPPGNSHIDLLQFSPKERWLACAVNSAELYMIDLADPELAYTRLPADGRLAALAFSSDGDKLWAADPSSPDNSWQLPSPKPTQSPPDPTRVPQTSAFTSRGIRIAAGPECAAEVRMVDLATGKVLWSHTERAVPATHALFSPDGKQFATAFNTPTGPKVKAWVSQTRALAYERSERPAQIFFRGEHLHALVEPATLAVKNLRDQSLAAGVRQTAASPSYSDEQFLFSPDGWLCAESAPDKSNDIAVWDLNKKALRANLRRSGQPSDLHAKAFSRDGSMLAAFSGGGVEVWETLQGKSVVKLPMQVYRFAFAKLDDKTDQLILIERNGTVSTWRPGTERAGRLSKLRLDANAALAADPSTTLITEDGTKVMHLALMADTPTLQVWNLSSGEQITRFPIPIKVAPNHWFPGAQHRLAASPDGRKLAVVSFSVTLRAWDRDAGRALMSLGAMDFLTRLNILKLSRDADSVLALFQKGNQGGLKVSDLIEQGELFTADLGSVAGCGALADRASLVAVGQQKEVWVYDPRSQKKVATLVGHEAEVSDVAFNQDATILASFSAGDGTVRLWNPKTGESLATFYTGRNQSQRVALGQSGKWLAVGDAAGNVRLWNLAEVRRQLQQVGLDWTAPALAASSRPAAGSAEIFLEEARRHHLFGRYAEAVAAYGKALKQDDKLALAYRDRGEALFQLGRTVEAATDFEKARDLIPELPASPTFLASLEARGAGHAESGQWEKAQADFQRAIKEGAERGKNQHEIARLRLAAGDTPGYQRACQSLVLHLAEKEPYPVIQKVVWTCALAPNAFPVYTRLIEQAEDAVDSHPKDPHYHRTLGAVLCRAGQFDAAIGRLNHALSIAEQQEQLTDWLLLAIAYQQAGHPEDAKRWLDKAELGIEQAKAQRSKPRPGYEQLELELLRHEAITSIKGTTTSRKGQTRSSK